MIEPPSETVVANGQSATSSPRPTAKSAGSSQRAAAQKKLPGTKQPRHKAVTGKPRRGRVARTFPASSFMEALPLAEAIQRFAAGQKIRRLTLFENLGRSPDSGHSRQLITNSAQYGLTKGSYTAEYLELTEDGAIASGDESLGRARIAARLELAINKIDPFHALYEQYTGSRLPALSVLRDFAIEHGCPAEVADECVQTFLANTRDLGLVRNYAGAERLLSFDMVLDEVEGPSLDPLTQAEPDSGEASFVPASLRTVVRDESLNSARLLTQVSDISNVCFFISPIGAEGTEQRKHADLVLGSLVEPALDGLGLRLVRADKITKPGLITAQVIDHLVRVPLVIADLSFGNPNVFYELALRHACRKPTIQLIRSSDKLPFDVGQFRTITLDMADIYTLVPQMESYRAEIARQCRAALDEEGPADSPLSLFYPGFWKQFGGS